MEVYINSTVYASETNRSYSRLYSNLSQLSLPDFTPEVSYFGNKSELGEIFKDVNFTNVLANMDTDHLYNA